MNGKTADDLVEPARQAAADFRVRKVLEALQQSSRYGVGELAAVVNLSASRLSRLFKSQTGVGLGEYICELRLLRAASLLATTEEPVKRIASVVGYSHSSSFVRAFHSRFAENPTVYRCKMQLS